MGLLAQETWIDAAEHCGIGETEVYETSAETPGELFRLALKQWGRCISSIYVDTKEGPTKRIGWVFQQIAHHEDTGEKFIRETWLTIHDKEPERTVEHFYHEL